VSGDMVGGARDAGITRVVVRAEAPGRANRERNIRNGWPAPSGRNWRVLLETLAHPSWLIEYHRSGEELRLDNWAPYAPAPQKVAVGHFFMAQTPFPGLTWRDVEEFRRLWPGRLVLKGLLHPADAVRAAESGADGIIVSNH